MGGKFVPPHPLPQYHQQSLISEICYLSFYFKTLLTSLNDPYFSLLHSAIVNCKLVCCGPFLGSPYLTASGQRDETKRGVFWENIQLCKLSKKLAHKNPFFIEAGGIENGSRILQMSNKISDYSIKLN